MTHTARRLITNTGTIDFPVLHTDSEGILLEIGSDPTSLANEQDTLTAAFLDVHTHGAVGHDVMHATSVQLGEMQRFLAQHGTASYLPTTVTASNDTTLRALEALADAVESKPATGEARPVGIHLEGPFLSHAKRGVHPPAELKTPSIELFERFQTAARGHIVLMTIAPELIDADNKPAALELIRHAAAKGVRLSMGHTNATAAQAHAGIEAGATSATHTFNAMRALDHREPGVAGVVLDDANIFAELICDGIHVAPEMVRLWLRSKGAERGILVTDGMSATGMPDGDFSLGDFRVTVKDGRALLSEDLASGKETLAGSVLTLDDAVTNIQRFTHADLGTATRLASHNPAAMLGCPQITGPRRRRTAEPQPLQRAASAPPDHRPRPRFTLTDGMMAAIDMPSSPHRSRHRRHLPRRHHAVRPALRQTRQDSGQIPQVLLSRGQYDPVVGHRALHRLRRNLDAHHHLRARRRLRRRLRFSADRASAT